MEPTWQSDDGSVRLFLGDCRDVLPSLTGVDAVVTDPPYGIGLRNGDVDGHRSDRWDSIEGDCDQSVGLSVLDWAFDRELPTVAFASPWKPWPGKWRNLIAWDKGGAVGGGGDIATCLKRSWELVMVARNLPIPRRLESVWRYPMIPSDTANHICAKPVELMEELTDTFSRGTVLDPFMGSGTTGVACVRLGRKFVGVEVDRRYFDVARNRIQESMGMEVKKNGVTQRRMFGVETNGIMPSP